MNHGKSNARVRRAGADRIQKIQKEGAESPTLPLE